MQRETAQDAEDSPYATQDSVEADLVTGISADNVCVPKASVDTNERKGNISVDA